MYDRNPASVLDLLTKNVTAVTDCPSMAGTLLTAGVSIFDAEVLGRLIAASDYLTAAAFDLAPGGTRHTLRINAIERRVMQATNLVTPAVLWRMHRDLTSLLIAHIRFFADETQLSVL